MKNKLKILNLDCAHCASELEVVISKIKGIEKVKINFVASKIELIYDKTETLNEVKKAIKGFDPQVVLQSDEPFKNKKINVFELALLFFGLAFGLIGHFVMRSNSWPYWVFLLASALLIGYKTYFKAIIQLFKGIINENLLVTISIIGAIGVGEHFEGLMVITLYTIGKFLESIAVNKSRKSISKLMELQPEFAIVVENGVQKKVDPDEVTIGTIIVVKTGERVPLDGVVTKGYASIDTKNLTGESLPTDVNENDKIISGSIVLDGLIYVKTTNIYAQSTVKRIMNMVEDASERKSKTETFINKFSKYYTFIVVGLATVVTLIMGLVLKNWDTAIYRGLTFLVISCPCAFAISVPLSYFSGLGNASKQGILIKGSNYLDASSKLKTIIFDKTGTLTTGTFKVDLVNTIGKHSKDEVIKIACLGEQFSIHPIAKAILNYANFKDHIEVENYKEIAGKGIEFSYGGFKYYIGKNYNKNKTSVAVNENGKLIGEIELSDKIKDESFETISELKKLGIKTIMLSGDNNIVAKKVADELKIDEYYADMLPEEKYNYVKDNCIKNTAFVGDGINDAPALNLASVGISMGISGSPATVEASDIVLVDDNPKKMVSLIKLSKFTKKIVVQNIVFATVVKVAFLVLGMCGLTELPFAVFADVGVTILAILNSLRALNYSDRKKHLKK